MANRGTCHRDQVYVSYDIILVLNPTTTGEYVPKFTFYADGTGAHSNTHIHTHIYAIVILVCNSTMDSYFWKTKPTHYNNGSIVQLSFHPYHYCIDLGSDGNKRIQHWCSSSFGRRNEYSVSNFISNKLLGSSCMDWLCVINASHIHLHISYSPGTISNRNGWNENREKRAVAEDPCESFIEWVFTDGH